VILVCEWIGKILNMGSFHRVVRLSLGTGGSQADEKEQKSKNGGFKTECC
jgi:hypothetical protein